MPYLLCHHSETTDRWTLSRETSPIRLGRSRDAEICLRDVGISKRHAEIVRRGPRWHIRDLGSRNGTLVNGFRVEGSSPLRDGDEITVGPVTIRFFLSEERAQAFADVKASAPPVSESSGANGECVGSTEIAQEAPRASAGEPIQAAASSPSADGPRHTMRESAQPLAARATIDEIASDPAEDASKARQARTPLGADPLLEETIRAIYERPRLAPGESSEPRERDRRARDRRATSASRPERPPSGDLAKPRRGRRAIAAILLLLAGFGLGRWTAPGPDPDERASPRDDEQSAQERLARSIEKAGNGASTAQTPNGPAEGDARGSRLASAGSSPSQGAASTAARAGAKSEATAARRDEALARLLGPPVSAIDDVARERATLRLALDLLERPLLRSEVEKLPPSISERVDAIIAIVEESRGELSIGAVLDAVVGDRLPETSRGEIGAAAPEGAREVLARIGRSTFYTSDEGRRSRNPSQRAASLWVDLLELPPSPENVDAVARAIVETGLSEVVRMLLYSSKSRLRGPLPDDREAARSWVRAEYLRFAGRLPTPSEEARAVEEIERAEQGWRYVIQDLATRPEYERY